MVEIDFGGQVWVGWGGLALGCYLYGVAVF